MGASKNQKLKARSFCGGRGGKNIINFLSKSELFDVTVLVNAYDDGLSTGYLRRLIPGFLGPSDIRKNMGYLIDTSNPNKRILKDILEYRFTRGANDKECLQDIRNILKGADLKNSDLDVFIKKTLREDLIFIKDYLLHFLDYISAKRINFTFDDCSLGNILLSGCFLKNNKDFNKMIEEFSKFLDIKGKVLNVTDGENLYMTAIKKDGEVLPSEASIVEKRSNVEIEEIFLLKKYLKESEIKKLAKIKKEERINYLRKIERYPFIANKAKEAIEECDLLIYSPGTQNSSLFPTYLTKGLSEAILSNDKCKKIFISNIGQDNEIPHATAEDLIEKAVYYLNRKDMLNYEMKPLMNYFFINAPKENDAKYIKFLNKNNLNNVIYQDFEEESEGKHSGKKITEKIMELSYETLAKNGLKKISIVIPAYNERRYIVELIERIKKVNFLDLGFITEIIVVDDGSNDGTDEILKSRKDIRFIRSPVNRGKGNSVILGIGAATGQIIVIQDADLEYNPADIKEMLRNMIRHNFKAVYGSRTIKKDLKIKSLSMLYGKRPEAYWSYYIGGQLLSFVTWLLYGEFITDTVTGYKMVDARLLKSFNLKSRGFELDHEITAKILKKKFDIYEIPISYVPRTVEEGKKIKWKDGLIAMKTLLKFRFRN